MPEKPTPTREDLERKLRQVADLAIAELKRRGLTDEEIERELAKPKKPAR